jgi:Tfp pilus assembly protein PilE
MKAAYADLGLTTPTEVAAHYTITISPPAVGAPPGFTAVATPSGQQVTDHCGVLAIDQAGTKTAGGVPKAECW